MLLHSLAPLTLLLAYVVAKDCQNITIPVTISARQAIFDIDVPQTSFDATRFIQIVTQQGRNFTDTITKGYQTVSGTYNISAQFCTPSHDSSANPTVQVLTHGIGFDKGYWDFPYNSFNYSYVDVATDQYKYCTLAIDRLGIGKSSHGEPLNEIQAPLEVAALAEITSKLRSGRIPEIPRAFTKVAHVGHSFGAAQSYALVAQYPQLSDGIVLTGFSTNGTFVPFFAAGANFVQANANQPFRLGAYSPSVAFDFLARYGLKDLVASLTAKFLGAYGLTDYVAGLIGPTEPPLNYPNGYLANANANSNQYLFFLPGFFDEGALLAGEAAKQPAAVGELLSLPNIPKANGYAGPVLVFTGSNDLPYCGGDCLATGDPSIPSIPSTVIQNFPNAGANFETYIQPHTGHGLNFHYNATAGYEVIQQYLGRKGLASS